jgi:hypothetical protein
MSGGEPDAEIEYGLNNGSQDRGIVLGYLSGALVWLLAS